jgi:hypothetical protein
VVITNGYNWQVGSLGNYYLPTNSPVIDKGNTNANCLGLYQFTTHTNQMKETNSIVDIGYHYVATGSNGIPMDSNGDGVPDYFQDANGNGLVDNGENPWMPAPIIQTQPASQWVVQGNNGYFNVVAISLVPVHYQWYFNSNQISGATNSILSVTNVQPANVGYYSVTITNPAGSAVSSNASLAIVVPRCSRLISSLFREAMRPLASAQPGRYL